MLIAARSMALFDEHGEALFTPEYWQARGALTPAARGRGSAWFIASGSFDWVLRHYRRGGWLATQVSLDRYLWSGEARVRALVEWRLLDELLKRGLPVPEPIGARYLRCWTTYRCDLITRRIPDAAPLSDLLAADRLGAALWRSLGATIARFHAAGVDHADLNAHNILMAPAGAFSIIDFDRGRLRPPGPWRAGNLGRLQRSLLKVSRTLPAGRFVPADWDELLAGYRNGAGRG
ncbi:MAG: 3-deoxy-D-manno-octulosonic acid kinase [Steroidobacterales bacterium]